MFLHRVQSGHGRMIPKPAVEAKHEEVLDEAIPIQDQIEALRTKIQLKQRYNKVLQDELKESRLGASSILQDLLLETTDLREQLIEAINSEKAAVQSALRTHREFQLAMTDKTPAIAIPWLDDKLFDISKLLNAYMHRMKEKRAALAEAEATVMQIEKWPRPGTLPWEVEAITNFHRLESSIENMKISLETTNILSANLGKIKQLLREEKGKYAPVIRGLDEQVASLKAERKVLKKMLEDAAVFREDAMKNLGLTEQEASENRKKRRRQMTKMRKAVTGVLESNQAKTQETVKRFSLEGPPRGIPEHKEATVSSNVLRTKSAILESMRTKRGQIQQYEARVKRLVDTMRVQDLRYIPTRYRSTLALGKRLQAETKTKASLRDLLLRQKNQLHLIMCHFSYTGSRIASEYKIRIDAYDHALREVGKNTDLLNHHVQQYGEIIVTLRMLSLALLNRLDEGRRRHFVRDYFPDTLKSVIVRVRKLMAAHKELADLFPEPASKNYALYVKNPPTTARQNRVGTPEHTDEESDGDDEFIDMKTPTRSDIKNKSARVLAQARLRLGITC